MERKLWKKIQKVKLSIPMNEGNIYRIDILYMGIGHLKYEVVSLIAKTFVMSACRLGITYTYHVICITN